MDSLEFEKLKSWLGIPLDDCSKDVALQFSIDDAVQTALNYCNLKELPDGLISTCYRMSIDIFRNENFGNEDSGVFVSSISEGDTSTSFKLKETESNYTDSILKNYSSKLNRYRKLVF